MRLATCPTCSATYEAVGPFGLAGLDKEARYKKLHCRCGTSASSFRRIVDLGSAACGEAEYERVVVPSFLACFDEWYAATSADEEVYVAKGLPWHAVGELAYPLGLSYDVVADWLGSSAPEFRSAVAAGSSMDQVQAYVLLFVVRLVGYAEAKLGVERGDMTAGRWVGTWLQEPRESLGGRPPSEFLCTPSRREAVAELLQAELYDSRSASKARPVMPKPDLAAAQHDFPRALEGVVAGAQPKLVGRLIGGRFYAGPTAGEVEVRYEACRALTRVLLEYADGKQQELAAIGRPNFLRQVRKMLPAKVDDFSTAELDWVVAQVDEALQSRQA